MNVNARTRKLTTVGLSALVGLTLVAAPVSGQEAERQAGADAGAQEQPRRIQVKILGMSCPFCAYGVEQKLKKLDGIEQLKVELKTGIATLTMKEGADVPNEKLKKTVDDAGFEAAAIVRNFESEHEDWHPEQIPAEDEGPGSARAGAGAGSTGAPPG